MVRDIRNHSGSKYLRRIRSAVDPAASILVDVYDVIEAFGVRCPARQHALKKILCAGLRDKGDEAKDVSETIDALSRALQLIKGREIENESNCLGVPGNGCPDSLGERSGSLPVPDQ